MDNKSFKSFKQIKNLLKEQQNDDLLQFTKKLLLLVKATNSAPVIKEKAKEKIVLDAIARLLVGDQTCIAIAISGQELLLATNKDLHIGIDDRMELELNIKFVRKNFRNTKYTFKYSGTLTDKSAHQVRKKEFGQVIYKLDETSNELKPDQKKLNITFSANDLQHMTSLKVKNTWNWRIRLSDINYGGDTSSYLRTLASSGSKKEKLFFFGSFAINPLRVRIEMLINHLGLIASQNRYETRAMFENSLYNDKPLDSPRELWWGCFLRQSLSYELSSLKNYKPYIQPYYPGQLEDEPATASSRLRELQKFYEELVNDYQKFKQKKDYDTSKTSIKEWFQDIGKNIKEGSIPHTPVFIKNNPDPFLEKAKRYFLDLFEVEKFIETDAREDGTLAKLLGQIGRPKGNESLKIISFGNSQDREKPSSTQGEIHAEMRLLEYTVQNGTDYFYFGITKLCCALCELIMKQLNIVDYRGFHGTLYGGWLLPKEFKKDKYLKKILGDSLYQAYQELSKETLASTKNPKHAIKKSDVALRIIEVLSGFNNEGVLQDLLIVKPDGSEQDIGQYLISESAVLYPPDSEEEDGQRQTLEDETKKDNYRYCLQQRDINNIAMIEYRYGTEESTTEFKILGSPQRLTSHLQDVERFRTAAENGNTKQTLTLIINLGNSHWVTLVVFYHDQKFYGWYVDSLNHYMPDYIVIDLQNAKVDVRQITVLAKTISYKPCRKTEYDVKTNIIQCQYKDNFGTDKDLLIGNDELKHSFDSDDLMNIFNSDGETKKEKQKKIHDMVNERVSYKPNFHNCGLYALEIAEKLNQMVNIFKTSQLEGENRWTYCKDWLYKQMMTKIQDEAYFQKRRKELTKKLDINFRFLPPAPVTM